MKNQIIKVTATGAARDFSRLLDSVEKGTEAMIERHGECVAVIRPVESRPRRASECRAMRLARPSVEPDPKFAGDLIAIIKGHLKGEPRGWD